MKLNERMFLLIYLILELFEGLCWSVQTSEVKSFGALKSKPSIKGVFTLVRFLNIPCSSYNGHISGICFSLNDCVRLKGTQVGSCAAGFGVCCSFQRSCGTVTNQNLTHFVNPGYPEGYSDSSENTCSLTILRSGRNPICQVRLDFLEFQTNRPTEGNCLDDVFSVQGNNPNAPIPEICGLNSGQHVYINVDESIAPLMLIMRTRGIGQRKWNIRASAIECNNPSRAPPNCLQYYTGATGSFSSFNHVPGATSVESGGYLNRMNYAICFRKEAGRCTQTYTARNTDSFVILNLNENGAPTVNSGEAGLGIDECPNDYLRLSGDRYCGARLNPSTATTANPRENAPVVDNSAGPFTAIFVTNGQNNAMGFNLDYSQTACNIGY